MFKDISLNQVNNIVSFAGNSSVFKGDDTIPELQAKGVTALCKILQNRQYAYLADEVGMGKTYQAMGVIAMLLTEKNDAKVLIIAPNESVQKNWKNEIDNFFKNNCKKDILNACDEEVLVTHPTDIVSRYVSEKKSAKIAIVRLTAFSNIAENVARRNGYSREGSQITAKTLYSGLNAITNQSYSKDGETYDYFDAGKICGSVFRRFSPEFDLVIVDEAQNIRRENNATTFFSYWMGLKRFRKMEAETPANLNLQQREGEIKDRLESKYLLLSATPAHRGVDSLRSQLYYFEDEDKIPEISHEYLEKFMIRRLRTYNGSSKYDVRNVCAANVSQDLDVKQRLFLALIQSRIAQIQLQNNASFKIGFLETFESYDASGEEPAGDAETGETNKEFENGGSASDAEKGSAKDKQLLQDLAKSFEKTFDSKECPPHPKLDYMQCEIEQMLNYVEKKGEVEKAIIFVRRLASVDELVNHRLNRIFENKIVSYWGERFSIENAKLSDIQKRFQKLYRKTKTEEIDEGNEDVDSDDVDEIKSPLISWMAVKKSGRSENLNSVSLFKKSLMRNKQNAFLFDENYYVTAHSKDWGNKFNNKKLQAKVEALVDENFRKEVCDYIQAEPSRYIQQRNNKRKLNYSYLLPLCCYIALSREQHVMASKIKEFYHIKDKVESKEEFLHKGQIISILKQPSLWNCLEKYDNNSGSVLGLWVTEDLFNKREAVKSWVEKYLKTSEAILELLYEYCIQRDRKNKKTLCESICEALYKKCFIHGLRISQLLKVDNANLVCNQILGAEEVDYRYDPKFMNNQQWVMPATGGNKGNEALIKRFNTPFYPDIIVCTDVLKEGINLHLFCSKVYHYGLAWTPGDLEQRIGRVDRFFSKTHRAMAEGKAAHIDVTYPYMGKSVDEQQLRKVLKFKLSADPLLDSTGAGKKNIEFNLTDVETVDELVKYTPSQAEQTNFPYSGEMFWKEE